MDAFPSIHVRLRFRLHVTIYECLWHVKKHKCKVRDELKMQQSNSQQIQIGFFLSLAAAANTALELHTITTKKKRWENAYVVCRSDWPSSMLCRRIVCILAIEVALNMPHLQLQHTNMATKSATTAITTVAANFEQLMFVEMSAAIFLLLLWLPLLMRHSPQILYTLKKVKFK